MKRIIPVVIGAALLGGCALPVPIQIASWLADGVSYLVSSKSLTDHGLSLVAEKDCALWRGVTEGEVCRHRDAISAIVDAGNVSQSGNAVTSQALGMTETDTPTSTVVAVNDSNVQIKRVSWLPVDEPVEEIEIVQVATLSDVVEVSVLAPLVMPETKVEPKIDMIAETPSLKAEPGKYFVIGSFKVWKNASRFAERFAALETQILPANVSGKNVFRIVVGPYEMGKKKSVKSSINDAGINETWSMRVGVDVTTIAWRTEPKEALAQLASVPSGLQ